MASTLTRREEDVLALAARGLTNAEIASELGIATRTVGKHLEHVYEKLDTRTRTGALAVWQKRP
jgi:DNA-binding CsgD family transcriptional regulator